MLCQQKNEIYYSVQETPAGGAAVLCGMQAFPPKHPKLASVESMVVQPHASQDLSVLSELRQGQSAHKYL